MSDPYGPLKWFRDGVQAFEADAGDNLPTGVTLTNAAGATAAVKTEAADGSLTTTAGVTVGSVAIVTGRQTGKASCGVSYTLTPGVTPPDRGDNYYVQIVIDRTDTTKEVIRQRLQIR